ncbi:MAG: hypothetical protein IPM82_26010 [Saprospiraceae bacterium]|nr:hypothetical protein [Saprospiraceae bacterium]
MMKTYLLCLANSKKYGERCIAGVQLVPDSKNAFHPLKSEGKPKWLRPFLTPSMDKFLLVWSRIFRRRYYPFDLLQPCPSVYQTENCLFATGSLQKVRAAVMTAAHLEQLGENQGEALLGNHYRSLALNEIDKVSRSLVLIKPDEVQPYFTTPYNTQASYQIQVRQQQLRSCP